MGIADFMANFTLLRSFESGTSAISIVLVTSFGSVIAMILSIFILRHRYDRIHILGSVIILSGIAVINYNKFISSKDHFVEFYGLFLALASSVGFAISNVTQEYCSMKEKGYPIASLFSMGFIGSLISLPFTNFTEIGISDRSSLLDNENSIKWVFSMGYILSTCCFYFMAPWYMRKFSAVSLSFSTLTCDIYIFIFSLTYTKVTMTPLYLCGFFMIMVGLLVFHTGKVTINGVEKMEIDFEKEPDQENPDVSVDVDGRLVGLR